MADREAHLAHGCVQLQPNRYAVNLTNRINGQRTENKFKIKEEEIMTQNLKPIPKWILIVSGLFAILGLIVSSTLIFSPESALKTVDLNAKGVGYLTQMWAIRQFTVGFIFAFATVKKSIPMLTLAYIFF